MRVINFIIYFPFMLIYGINVHFNKIFLILSFFSLFCFLPFHVKNSSRHFLDEAHES